MSELDIILIIFSAAFGLVIGSFLNVCIYRIPKGIFFARERSYCPKCGKELKWYHNIPLFSYIFLGGRCAFCKERISARYPMVEFLNMSLWAVNYLVFGLSGFTIIMDIAVSVLIVMSFIDIDIQEIPNGIVIIAAVLGVISIFVDPSILWWERIIGAFCISVPMFILALITGGFGGGDIKLYFGLGMILGWKLALVSALFAVILAAVGGIILMLVKKADKKSMIPFGPYIALGFCLASYIGGYLVDFYAAML